MGRAARGGSPKLLRLAQSTDPSPSLAMIIDHIMWKAFI